MRNKFLISLLIIGLFLQGFSILIGDNTNAGFPSKWFGSRLTTGSTYSISTQCGYGKFTCNGTGYIDNVSLYLTISGNIGETPYVKCQVLFASNGTCTGVFTQFTDLGDGFTGWIKFEASTKPHIYDTQDYYFAFYSNCGGTATAYYTYATSGGLGVYKKYPSFSTIPCPSTSLTTTDSDGIMRAYANYSLSAVNPNPPSSFTASPVVSSTSSLYVSWSKGLYADYTRVQYKTGSNPTTISDGTNSYNNTGTSFTQSGLTTNERYYFSAWSFNVTYKTWSLTNVSSNARVYAVPLKPSLFLGGFDSTQLYDIVAWEKGTNATYTRVQYSSSSYPTTISTGTNLCNITGNHSYIVNSGSVKYYFSAWSWNTTTKLWSSDYKTVTVSIPVVCGSTDLTFYNNTHNTSGKYETKYNSVTGWKVWANFTGITTPLHIFENIGNAFGVHTHILNNTGYWIHANYTSALTKGNNIINATGTHESYYDSIGNTWRVWANYTGDTTPIELLQNIEVATGEHEYCLNSSGYHVWANYTGTGSNECDGVIWVNYSDENLSFNVSIDKSDDSNTSEYLINENNWLFLSGFSLGNGELGLFFIFIFFSLAFIIDKESEKKSIWKPILLFMDTPISLATGVYYLGLGVMFSVAWFIGVILILFSVLLAFGGLYYSLDFAR